MTVKTKIGKFPTKLDRPILLGTFGDSTAIVEDYSGTTGYTNKPVNCLTHNSVVVENGQINSAYGATMIGFDNLVYRANGVHSGYNTTQLIANLGEAQSDYRRSIDDIIALGVDCIEYNGASVNNINYSPADDGEVPNEIIDTCVFEHVKNVLYIKSRGIPCISIGILGYNNGIFTQSEIEARQRAAVKINNRLAQELKGIEGVYFVNPEGISCVNGSFISGFTSDGIHPTEACVYAIGKEKSKYLGYIFSGESSFPTITYSCAYDYVNNTDGQPNKTRIDASEGVTINSKSCNGIEYIVDVTISALSHWINVQHFISGVLTGLLEDDSFAIHSTVEITDKDTGESASYYMKNEISFILLSDTNKSVSFGGYRKYNGKSNYVLTATMPLNANMFHQTWSKNLHSIEKLPLGNYLIKFTPPVTSKIPA